MSLEKSENPNCVNSQGFEAANQPTTKGFTMNSVAQNQTIEQTVIVAFNGASLITAKIKEVIYVAMRPIVEAIGLDWAGQTVKLNRSKEKFNCCDITTVAEDGKNRSMLFMPLRKLNGWLFSINPEKVRPDLQEAVIQYQEECFEVLHNYWTKGIAINPRQTITPEQQAILHSIVDRRVNGFDSLRGGLWKRHNKHFGIAKYNQLLASRFDDAVVYLETAELRYPKPKEKINDGCYFLMAKDGVVIYQLPISQQAINSELANNKPLLLEHIKQVVGEFVGKEALPAPKPTLDINYPAISARPRNSFLPNQHWFQAKDFVNGNFDPVRDFLDKLEQAGYEVTGLKIINNAKTWIIQQQDKAFKQIEKGYKGLAEGVRIYNEYGMGVTGFTFGNVTM